MEFEVLGPLRARAGGQPAPLTAMMPRTLLAILLIRANTAVPVDVLVDALWAGRRDPRAVKKLHLHVHRLRRALDDPARIRFGHGGYTLRLYPGELDAQRFETVLAEGTDTADPGRAMHLLRSALGLWRGDPFGGVADVALVRAEIDRLTERRLIGLEGLYGAELACGHAPAVVPELGELATRHPLRERLQGLLMTALYQAGRRAEALGVYHRTRAALVEELALEPGPELQRLERAILTDGPALETEPITLPAQLPPDITDFTGREVTLATVHQHLAPRPGRSRTLPIAAIAGMAGAGKTALAVHAAHRLREHYPHGQLYVDLRGAQAQSLEATEVLDTTEVLDPAEVLARFLRALGVTGTAIPDDGAERGALYRSLLAGRRMLILLDNAAGEAQVRPLLPGTPGCAVLITSRVRLAGLSGAQLVDLGILQPDQAVELLTRVVGSRRVAAEPAAAGELVRLCGYLPLAVRVAAVRLSARPHWQLARLATDLADEHHRLDELRLGDLDVRASLALSYLSLDETGRRVFRRLGLLSTSDFPPWVCAALLDLPQPRAEDLMDALVDAQVLDVAGSDAAGRQRYRCHDLLRVYAREVCTAQEPAGERLAALERAFGGWLVLAEEAGARMADPVSGVTLESVSCWRPDATIVGLAAADPAGWFQAEWTVLIEAVEQAHSIGSDQLACALGARLAPFYTIRGCHDDWQHICELMLAAARRIGNHHWMGTALRGLAELSLVRYDLVTAMDAFEQVP
ncbi:MAG: BTAD domain-containing putative transcriptional regulator [Pseudonocardiaceae bacterium]